MKRTTRSRKLAAAGRALLALGCVAALGCDQPVAKKPAADLTATPEAVTLIQQTEERCVKIEKTGLARAHDAEEDWKRQREDVPGAVYKTEYSRARLSEVGDDALAKYLQDDAVPELAAVDRAGELLQDLMPKVKEEAPPEIQQAVQAMSASQRQVCLRVRNARSLRSGYQEGIDAAVHDYDNAEAKLQALYTVSSTDTQFALNKFNPQLDEARNAADRHASAAVPAMSPEQLQQARKEWEATQEIQQREQAEHEAAVIRWRQREEGKTPVLAKVGMAPDLAAKESLSPETKQQSVQSWYARYSAKAAAVHAAYDGYMSVRRLPQDRYLPACQELLNATSVLTGDPSLLDPPDNAAARSLKKAYGDLQQCAQACLNGLTAETAFHLSDYQKSIAEAAVALQPYGVAP